MESKKFRVSVVGVGRMGAHHVRVLSAHPGFELVGVFDQDPQRATAIANEFGLQAWPDEDMLWNQSEVLAITCPTSFHAYWMTEALRRKMPFLVEKPVTHDATSCELLLPEVPADFPAMVGHIERFNPAVMAAGILPTRARIFECNRHAPFTSRGADVSVVMDLMIHDLDLLWSWKPIWPVDVWASGTAGVGEGPDHVIARLHYADGTTAALSASRLADVRQRNITCTGEGWQIRMDLSAGEVFHTLSHTEAPDIRRLVIEASNALVLEYNAWHTALVNKTSPASSLSHASQVLRLAETINRLACS